MPPYMYSQMVLVEPKATLPVKTKGNFFYLLIVLGKLDFMFLMYVCMYVCMHAGKKPTASFAESLKVLAANAYLR